MLIFDLCAGFGEAMLAVAGALFEATFEQLLPAVVQAFADAVTSDDEAG
ncbi:MAG TPA: hypothetical protein VK669_06050 [Candidatus Limnocylindrales bacterium]|nr:hypothetical protein [Candidatus Limnocylindrales bacterium]